MALLSGFPVDFDGFRKLEFGNVSKDFAEVFYFVPQELQKLTIRKEDGERSYLETISSKEQIENDLKRQFGPNLTAQNGKRNAYLSPWDFIVKDFPIKIMTKVFEEEQMHWYGTYIHDFLKNYFEDKNKYAFGSKEPLTWSERLKVHRDLETFRALWPSKEALKGINLLAVTREADESMTFDFPDNPEIPGFNIKNKILADTWFGARMQKVFFATNGDSPNYSSRK
jgi:hypothetical protein